ncbi:MAG: zinc ribbon domain-containing protein [Chloroflexota bacterium]|nr:zinc ribbon domain-containing protein [Chloroflexota bacterium]
MPIYEYRCNACRKCTSVFVRTVSSPAAPTCEHCSSADVERLFSRVAVLRGDDGLDLAESSLGDVDENDPRSVAKWVRKMSREMGEPLDGGMQSELERMEAGETPDDDSLDDGDHFGGLD